MFSWLGPARQNSHEKLVPLLGQFNKFIERVEKQGQLCNGKEAPFVPPAAIEKYWSIKKIDAILEALPHPVQVTHETIQRNYRKVLSILARIAPQIDYRIDVIQRLIHRGLDDDSLPLRHDPRHDPSLLADVLEPNEQDQFWDQFLNAQWAFCPATLGGRTLDGAVLDARIILPVTESKLYPNITHGSRTIRIVSAHPESLLSEEGGEEENLHIALKTYPPKDSANYEREIDAFRFVLNNRSKGREKFYQHIVGHFGSFAWVDDDEKHHTLMMEFAPFGTLRKMYTHNKTPFEFDDIKAFWSSMLGILKGLAGFHDGVYRNWRQGIHQDLKPDNILVCDGMPRNGHFHKTMKLADFDRSCILGPEGPQTPGARGSRAYSPPERGGELDLHGIEPCISADLWSVACIFIEAAVWLVGGEHGRDEFRKARKEEIIRKGHEDQPNEGLADCYHDGFRVLRCVEEVPETIDRVGRRSDNITGKIVRILLDEVLLHSKDSRLPARLLCIRLEKVITSSREPSLRRYDDDGTETTISWGQLSPTPRTSTGSVASTPTPITSMGSVASIPPAPVIPNSNGPLMSPGLVPPQSPQSMESVASTPPAQPIRNSNDHLMSPPPFLSDHSFPDPNSSGKYRRSMDSLRRETMRTGHDKAYTGRSVSTGARTAGVRHKAGIMTDRVFEGVGKLTRNFSGRRALPPSPIEGSVFHGRDENQVKFQEAVEWRRQNKDWINFPGLKKRNVVTNRDIWLLVDNSRSMQRFGNDLQDHLGVLTCILKELDSDGLDLAFTSSSGARIPCMTHRDVEKEFLQNFSDGGECFAENALTNIWTAIKKKRQKPASIFFLTDGLWDTKLDEESGVAGVVETMIKDINRLGLAQNFVSIHLVRYGDSQLGKSRLEYLDDNTGWDEVKKEQIHDIVDHKSAYGPLWEIVIGPLSPRNDSKPAIQGIS